MRRRLPPPGGAPVSALSHVCTCGGPRLHGSDCELVRDVAAAYERGVRACVEACDAIVKARDMLGIDGDERLVSLAFADSCRALLGKVGG